MPTYQYLCRDCDHLFDTVQSIHDDALTVCPECGGIVRRVLHPVGVTFKGSGFYRTDSREKKSTKVPASKEAAAAGGAKDAGGTGAKEGSGSSESGSGAGTKAGDTSTAKAAPAGKSSGSSPAKS